jgi:hypothetical protein
MAVRNWRQVKPGLHTRETVRSETLSPEAKALLVSQQAQIDALSKTVEAVLKAISDADAERKRGAA